MYIVTVVGDRPDFRCFLDLLYGPGRDVDTDGDSFPVSSRSWTYLHVKDRESDDPCVEIQVNEADGAIFNVQSESSRLEELAALYLFLACGGSISSTDRELDEASVRSLCEKYSVELGRARSSIWQLSTDESPFP
ncbi:hypothetical protein BIZ92_20575 [Achromobacter xylosoxidans]|uniref:Uncharacterized protein n=1 Tax=Alcaligenes xylosoxydans xylosoxydans TaxID=85698 RepID=A0A1R1JX56_ALCXX|nr:hypothetical protein BIZ92_20575 [Achromobacter xylosoxidans]